ncbi:hypothetical protein [Amycolatopsis taiwanensis]|uniref:hypothetical protein n=1 Tax=Amycolatopsis taiwanensis TaxID=342230 RepID=UPI000488B16E|nr:hypothetical protein [Amycolatopsis taiwanensis]
MSDTEFTEQQVRDMEVALYQARIVNEIPNREAALNALRKGAVPPVDGQQPEICGDVLYPGVTCQSPAWRCAFEDHGWSNGKRRLTWSNHGGEA